MADVKAQEAFIAGVIQGNITVGGRLELASTARVTGDLQAAVLSIAAGAIFNGKATMQETSGGGFIENKAEEADEE